MRRDPATFEVYAIVPQGGTAYGFTGHEHIDLFMLVNMDGRMYDPVLGRFLSPDPVLQFPNYTQGLNPYSYALNNPLRFVDPNGYSLVGQLFAVTFSILLAPISPILSAAVYSLVMTIDHAIEIGRAANFGNLYGYFVQTFFISTVTSGVTKGIGDYFDAVKFKSLPELRRAIAHGTFNGAMRWAQGGKFEHGFLSGFVSSLGGSYLQANGANMTGAAKIAISAAIGGTAEALGGGKFANGAVTGAYVMAWNHMMHGDKWHPTREKAAEATKNRTETTGNEASYLVFKDECGDEYYWEVPADPKDGPDISYWNEPTEASELALVENVHYSQGFDNTGKKYLAGSFQDYRTALEFNIKVTHISLGFGKWTFYPGTLFNPAASFSGLAEHSIEVWANPTPYGTFPYGYKAKIK